MHPPNATEMADVLIRDARVGDGEGYDHVLARPPDGTTPLISPEHFRAPDADGHAAEFDAATARCIRQATALIYSFP